MATAHAEEFEVRFDRAGVDFTQIPNWILDADISDGAGMTLSILRTYAYDRGTVWPSVRKLAERRRKNRATIFRHLDELEAAGLLRRQARYRNDGGRTSSVITLAWDRPLNAPALAVVGADSPTEPDPLAAEVVPIPVAEMRRGPVASVRHQEEDPSRRRTPKPPGDDIDLEVEDSQGAAAPRTPRYSKQRPATRAAGTSPRAQGTNPRATASSSRQLTDDLARRRAMTAWARRMYGILDADEFDELVDSELRAGIIDDDQADIARTVFAQCCTEG